MLYVLNAPGPNVRLGMWCVEAQLRFVSMIGSLLGTVSVPYEIQKCHCGSMWELYVSQLGL